MHHAVHGREKDALTEGSSNRVFVVHQKKNKKNLKAFIYPLTLWALNG